MYVGVGTFQGLYLFTVARLSFLFLDSFLYFPQTVVVTTHTHILPFIDSMCPKMQMPLALGRANALQ